jgi:ABC-2 type transport system ATP-binding protein
MTAAISTRALSKRYGRRTALDGLDLEVRRGEVFAYLGPNGAGKTTTIRLLLDLIRPSSGRVEVLGLDSRAASLEIRRRTGYLAGELALYDQMSGRELLSYLSNLRGGDHMRRAEQLAGRLELDLSRPIRALSKGNKQKVGLVQAFMHDPELLILDEPTSGLDPLVQQEFHRMVEEVRAGGATLFLSSHVLSEVERVADRVAILRDGRLVELAEIGAVKAKALRRLDIVFARPVPPRAFEGLAGVREGRVQGVHASFDVEGAMDALIKAAAQHEVASVTSHEPDLEEMFLAHYEGGHGRAA